MYSYHAVVSTTLTTEVERFIVQDTIVDNTIREHRLVCDTEDEDSEGEVLGWFGVTPHI